MFTTTRVITVAAVTAAICPMVASAAPVDLRSPDARLGHPTDVSPPAHVPSAGPTADGFAWGDAAIGAGGALVIVALALGGGMLAAGRRRSRVPRIAVG